MGKKCLRYDKISGVFEKRRKEVNVLDPLTGFLQGQSCSRSDSSSVSPPRGTRAAKMPPKQDKISDDPKVYIYGDTKLMNELRASPYDPKKNVWAPDEKEVYIAVEIKEEKGDKCTVQLQKGSTKEVAKDKLVMMNPPKFICCEDMANMTYLNDASVLATLRDRYANGMIYEDSGMTTLWGGDSTYLQYLVIRRQSLAQDIYKHDKNVMENTYSGLFCVVINPFRRLPLYTEEVVAMYRGKRRQEMPPHLFSVADNAYQNMLIGMKSGVGNQSILITGESGAGKTENTKKVISYFALVAAMGGPKKDLAEGEKKITLEDQIVQTNPVLESFGNAKTVRNNNSSRFGKFIRIHFNTKGKLAGADIESYLLEKVRVIEQLPGMERGYHIFYQLLSSGLADVTKMLMVTDDAHDYRFLEKGEKTIKNVDDKEEMVLTDEAFDVLGFTQDEKTNIYKLTGGLCHFSNMKFKAKPREEQAECDGTEAADKMAYLYGINSGELQKGLLKPRVKVGNEWVAKGQNCNQCIYAVGALGKGVYDRLFKFLVKRCNDTLDTKMKRENFIGVLDIAGFEIFEFNSFDQLCINYTNEKLQQFFNHHMFVEEQEEYKREGIEWETIDFGMDLAKTLALIEKPLGILAILEEQTMFPKASDKTLIDKLRDQHLGKHPSFLKPKKPKQPKYEGHFDLAHYAGNVTYNICGWLEKNKDPMNETVVACFKRATNDLLKELWADFATAEDADAGQKKQAGGKGKKGGAFQSASATHRDQLARLMATLHTTYPHFVRCIIPNELKTPGLLDNPLVMHQLTCNGVLEGIRICQKGFPNKMIFKEFKQRYKPLDPVMSRQVEDDRECSVKLLDQSGLSKECYGVGKTKIFFKAGQVAKLEDIRDAKLAVIVTTVQQRVRGKLQRIVYEKLKVQREARADEELRVTAMPLNLYVNSRSKPREALKMLQRNVRNWISLRTWEWWKLFCTIKPLLSQSQGEEELRLKEEELTEVKEGVEKEETLMTDIQTKLTAVEKEKNELASKLSSEQSETSDIAEKAEGLIKNKADLEQKIVDYKELLQDEEAKNSELSAAKRKVEGEVDNLKKDLEELEKTLQKVEKETRGVESKVRSTGDELHAQDDQISKLSKEKAKLEQLNATTLEDLQKEEDKVNNLSKLKAKLEQQLDDLEENLEREKKARAEAERLKRKLEGDLKAAQETLGGLENETSDLTNRIQKKEFEIKHLEGQVEDNQGAVAGMQRKIKEAQSRIDELEQELEAERNARGKVDKQRADLARELEDLGDRLEEAGGATAAQAEVNKKREIELQKLRRELEEANMQHEATVGALRKKLADATSDLTEQVENLQRIKGKLDKEKTTLKMEVDDLASNVEAITKGKLNVEKANRSLEEQIAEANIKIEESTRTVQELTTLRHRLESENSEIARQLEDTDNQCAQLSRAKSMLSQQLEELKRQLEEETKAKNHLTHQLRAAQHDCDSLKVQIEEEQEGKSEIQRALSKANTEVTAWRTKYETDAIQRAEELEDAKKKLAARLQDAEEQVEAANAKCSSLEKAKNRLAGEVEDLMIDVERANAAAAQLEKKQRLVDKQIAEWKTKCEEITIELETSTKEARAYANELYKLKGQYEETLESLETLKKENKTLADEIRDLSDQLGEGGKSVHELEKAKKRLEVEKEELQTALEEAEGALEVEEGKVLRVQLELSQLKADIDRRLAEKDEEFENTRKNHQRALDALQTTLDVEVKGRNEAVRTKKKLEADVNEVEAALENATRANNEARKTINKLQMQIQEVQTQIDDEQRQREEAREHLAMSERRSSMLQAELEELRNALDQAERARKMAESELMESSDRVGELSAQNSSLAGQKRKLEGEIQTLQAELDEVMAEHRQTEEKAKKAIADATRIAEDLRNEQEHTAHIEKTRKNLEASIKDLQRRLDEAEALAMKGGKRALQKLEARVRDLESELDSESRRHQETLKSLRKNERRLKELSFQADEDRKKEERMQEMVEKLQLKIKTYKRQVEEAEETANVNLAKWRKTQHDLEDAQERAEMAESALGKMRAQHRSAGPNLDNFFHSLSLQKSLVETAKPQTRFRQTDVGRPCTFSDNRSGTVLQRECQRQQDCQSWRQYFIFDLFIITPLSSPLPLARGCTDEFELWKRQLHPPRDTDAQSACHSFLQDP
ncbi:Myosin-7 [Branchiostoma belcheri]|nr:Myosin-7 [Branchiostoma belcheri]